MSGLRPEHSTSNAPTLKEELRACPFCGAVPVASRNEFFRIQCKNDACPAVVEVKHAREEEAARRWNGLATTDGRVRERLEALWRECTIIYYPEDSLKPIEHNLHAGKDSRWLIESALLHAEPSTVKEEEVRAKETKGAKEAKGCNSIVRENGVVRFECCKPMGHEGIHEGRGRGGMPAIWTDNRKGAERRQA